MDVPLPALLAALAVLLIISGFFSLAETAMMAATRYRLKATAQAGHRGARRAMELLATTDRLLGVILLFNNLVNAAAATLVSVIAIELFGEHEWALGAGTLAVTFLILVFAEISPKVVGAAYADRLAPWLGYVLAPLLRLFHPIVWFVNLFVSALLRMLRLKPSQNSAAQVSPQELRALVLEAGNFIPPKHRSILVNLFELEDITVADVMTPRGQIEALDINAPLEEIHHHIATCYHTRLPVCDGDFDQVIGILHLRRFVAAALADELDRESLRERLAKPYFVPGSTPLFSQIQYFQENQQRMALVVDEYGEVEGLITLEDLVEELIGKFTTSLPGGHVALAWDKDGAVVVEGGRSLREINRHLAISLPTTGPRTLNGLILEHFQDIPEAGISVRIAGVPMEILQTQDRMVKIVRMTRPKGYNGAPTP